MLFWDELNDDLARLTEETHGSYEPEQGLQFSCYGQSDFPFCEPVCEAPDTFHLDPIYVECDSSSPQSSYQGPLSYPLPWGGYDLESQWP